MVVASIAGVWLFSVQHRFETARWTAKGDWSFADAALQGSSWFGLPPFLHWLTEIWCCVNVGCAA
jgi:omega-6 fatty acid desaturase (delta-12 desaturase)